MPILKSKTAAWQLHPSRADQAPTAGAALRATELLVVEFLVAVGGGQHLVTTPARGPLAKP
jgi:hypothetical protein